MLLRPVYAMKGKGVFYSYIPEYCTILNADQVILYVNALPYGEHEIKCYTEEGQPAALTREDALIVARQLELPTTTVKLYSRPSFNEESEAGWWVCSPRAEPSTQVEERVPETVQRPTPPITGMPQEEPVYTEPEVDWDAIEEEKRLLAEEEEREEEEARLREEEEAAEELANTLTSLLLIKTLGERQ